MAGYDLNLALDREVILAAGGPSTSKSWSIVKLALMGEVYDFKVVVLDRDRGVAKAIKEITGERKLPKQMTYFLAKNWDIVKESIDYSMDHLGAGDWMCFDMVGGIWDLAQSEFTRMVYGGTIAGKLLALRAEAESVVQASDMTKKEATSERASKIGFEGLEGRYDWPLIKKMHNDDLFDMAILNGDFNVFSTTSMTPLQDATAKAQWPMFAPLGRRPEGEKHQIHRHDTIMVIGKENDKFTWRTDLGDGQGKDRGREFVRGIDYTGMGLVESYLRYHELAMFENGNLIPPTPAKTKKRKLKVT